MITRLDNIALHSHSVITVVRGCIPFFEWEEMMKEGGLKIVHSTKSCKAVILALVCDSTWSSSEGARVEGGNIPYAGFVNREPTG